MRAARIMFWFCVVMAAVALFAAVIVYQSPFYAIVWPLTFGLNAVTFWTYEHRSDWT